jgi:hypothetical protein
MRFTIILAIFFMIISCSKKEDSIDDPCNPYTFKLNDGDSVKVVYINGSGVATVSGVFEGCFDEYGFLSIYGSIDPIKARFHRIDSSIIFFEHFRNRNTEHWILFGRETETEIHFAGGKIVKG